MHRHVHIITTTIITITTITTTIITGIIKPITMFRWIDPQLDHLIQEQDAVARRRAKQLGLPQVASLGDETHKVVLDVFSGHHLNKNKGGCVHCALSRHTRLSLIFQTPSQDSGRCISCHNRVSTMK